MSESSIVAEAIKYCKDRQIWGTATLKFQVPNGGGLTKNWGETGDNFCTE